MKNLNSLLKKSLLGAGLGLGMIVSLPGCTETVAPVIEEHWNLYRDVYGNAEFESRFDSNPRTDDYYDDGILVTLFFGEDTPEGFHNGDIYGYYMTQDTDPVNYWMKFIPEGRYYLESDLDVVNESNPDIIDAYHDSTPYFYQEKDVDSVEDMFLRYIGSYDNGQKSKAEGLSPGKFYMPREVYNMMQDKKSSIETENPEHAKNLEGFLKSVTVVDKKLSDDNSTGSVYNLSDKMRK